MAWGSNRIANLVQSDIRAMTKECIRLQGINLGQGLCELPTPPEVVEAAQAALTNNKKNIYSSPEGILPLRQKISQKLARENNINADPETEVIVTMGSTGGYAAALMGLLNPGDGIILFEPFYGYHLNAALLAGLEAQTVPFSGPGLQISESAIRQTLKPNSRAIVICTPNNPSGKMWTADEIEIVAKIANEKNLLVITDEMYEYFRYDGRKHLSPASFAALKDRTVTLMGLSKTFSITGWRLGYVAAPAPIAEKIRLANDLFYVCAPTPLQYGVAAGFDIDDTYFKELEIEFTEKREKLCNAFLKAGMEPIVPQGAYYILADITKFKAPDSKTFAMTLLESAKVATVPGRAFFTSAVGENYIRANFAVNDPDLDKACMRISQFKGGF